MTNQQIQTEPSLDRPLTILLIDRIAQLISQCIKYGFLLAIAIQAKEAIASLAGEQTDASFALVVDFLGKTNSGTTITVWTVLGSLGVAYGVVQKRLRRRTISHLAMQIKELELLRDPHRSSSNLTPIGTTNPRDI